MNSSSLSALNIGVLVTCISFLVASQKKTIFDYKNLCAVCISDLTLIVHIKDASACLDHFKGTKKARSGVKVGGLAVSTEVDYAISSYCGVDSLFLMFSGGKEVYTPQKYTVSFTETDTSFDCSFDVTVINNAQEFHLDLMFDDLKGDCIIDITPYNELNFARTCLCDVISYSRGMEVYQFECGVKRMDRGKVSIVIKNELKLEFPEFKDFSIVLKCSVLDKNDVVLVSRNIFRTRL
jgi:hypothetical protein